MFTHLVKLMICKMEERKFIKLKKEEFGIKEYIKRNLGKGKISNLDIEYTPVGEKIIIHTSKPGLVIGRKGVEIKKLTANLERKFGYENLQIEANEVEKPALNAKIMASKVASALERGWNYRRAGNSILQRIMDAGARGCQITIAGKLTGLRHRTEKFISGHIKHCGEVALQNMKIGHAQAKLKPGTIGVKVALMPPEAKLPDEISVVQPSEVEDTVDVNDEVDKVVESESEDKVVETGSEDKVVETGSEDKKEVEKQ